MQVLYKATMSGLEPRATLAMRVGHEFLDCRRNPAGGWVNPQYFDECRQKVDAAIDEAMKMPNAALLGGEAVPLESTVMQQEVEK
jgi:hypothetical protein